MLSRLIGVMLVTASLYAQNTKPPTIAIGGNQISIGMPVDTLLGQLSATFDVTSFEKDSVLHLSVSYKGKGRNNFPFASIYSKGNRVIGVEREILDKEVGSTNDLFNALFKEFSRLSNENRTSCQADTGTGYIPEPPSLSKAWVQFSCGPYRIVLLRNEFESDGKMVDAYLAREELGITQ